MHLKIIVNSEEKDSALRQAKLLKKWIEEEEIDDLIINLEKRKLGEDEAGGGVFEAILSVILGAPAVVVLAKSIHVWMKEKTKRKQASTKKISLTIESSKGDKIIINAENIGDTEQNIINKLYKILT